MTELAQTQGLCVMLASAASTRSGPLLRAIEALVRDRLPESAVRAALSAATIMAMNNVYYRFVHLCTHQAYGQLPARLRMQVIADPGVPKLDFELMSLAVSAINGCGRCIDAHEQVLRASGVREEAIAACVRIAAIVAAAGAALEIERSRCEPASP